MASSRRAGYFFFLLLPFSLLDFPVDDLESLDFESLDLESVDFDSDDFESLDFESGDDASLDLESEESPEFDDPPSPGLATDVLSAFFPL
jgi:hypothetical protein